MSLEDLRAVLAEWLQAISPGAKARRRRLLLIRFERDLLMGECREARRNRQRQRQHALWHRLGELTREQLRLERKG